MSKLIAPVDWKAPILVTSNILVVGLKLRLESVFNCPEAPAYTILFDVKSVLKVEEACNAAKVPAATELPPITVPSIAPPSMFTVPIFTVPFPDPSVAAVTVKLPIPSIVVLLLNNTSVSCAIPIVASVERDESTFVEKTVAFTLNTA